MESRAGARVVLVQPAGGGAIGAAALEGLGPDARVDRVEQAGEAVARALAGDVDVVLVAAALGDDADWLLRTLQPEALPVVVLGEELAHEEALAWFRRGAADCVSLRGGDSEALPLVVLEQVRRSRALRARSEAERRIRDLEGFSENVIRNMNSAVLVVDRAGAVTSCNLPAAQILGRPVRDVLGAAADEWFRDASGRSLVARTLAEGARFKGAESVITRPDGTTIPVGLSCAPLPANDGSPLGAVATFQDLTEIRELQRQVLQTEKMASIGQLAAGVAHEINNPMGFIHANLFQMSEYVADLRRLWNEVEALQKQAAQGDGPELQRACERVAALAEEVDVEFLLDDLAKAIRESQEGSERIRHIVQDLRDFSRHDTAERTLADINQCLDSTANIVWPMMKHLVVLEKEYRELPALNCHPMQLKQVFMNLLVNAYQAIEARVAESGATGRVRLGTEHRDGLVTVTVSDTGVGVAPENLSRIFDPFFTTKKVGAGTGLGLSTSYSIVRRHGGTIRVESRVDEGTTFRVVLPVEEGVDVET